MADPNVSRRFIIYLGNGATPEVFGAPCGATTYNTTLTNNLTEWTVMDCDDPLDELPATQRVVNSQDTSLEISGRVATSAWPAWRDWADGGVVKNVRLVLDESAANNGGYWQLPALIQSLQLTKEEAGAVNFTAQIVGAGRRAWTAAT